jgi:hypothetical protein
MGDKEKGSTIEEKREKINNPSGSRKNNWKGFGKDILNNLISTFLIALIGVNFIYFTSLNTDAQDKLFPSELNQYLPKINLDNRKQVGGRCSFVDRNEFSSKIFKNENLKKIGIPPSDGWPYTMIDKTGEMDFSSQGFKNWFAMVTANVYSLLRGGLKEILRFFSKETEHIFSYDLVQILFITFAVPIIIIPLMMFILILLFVLILFQGVMCAWKGSSNPLFTLFVAWFPAALLSLGITGILPIHLLLTMLVFPPYADSGSVSSILRCNMLLFITLFIFLTTLSAFQNELPPLFNAGLVVATGVSLGPHILQSINKMRRG